MGFFSTLFGCKQDGGDGRFQSEAAYAENRSRQLTMTPQTVAQLKKYGVTDESQLKLEYFFTRTPKRRLPPWFRHWPGLVTLVATTIPRATRSSLW